MKEKHNMLLLIVLSGLIISLCMGLRQSLGLFMRPMTLDAGISAATFGFAIALQNIVWGVSQPFVGALADKHGPRPILIWTALIYAAGMLLMVFSHGELGLDIAGFMLGLGTAGTAFGVLIGVVTRAVPEDKRSQTVGLVAASGSLGTMVLAPFGGWLILFILIGILGLHAIDISMQCLDLAGGNVGAGEVVECGFERTGFLLQDGDGAVDYGKAIQPCHDRRQLGAKDGAEVFVSHGYSSVCGGALPRC
jgi:MFS family permease